MEIGIVGLGRMGANMARRMARWRRRRNARRIVDGAKTQGARFRLLGGARVSGGCHKSRWSYLSLRTFAAISFATPGWRGLMRMLCSSGTITDGTSASSAVFP